jgi:UTP-glucose-1-phosphate uridylyltransferase
MAIKITAAKKGEQRKANKNHPKELLPLLLAASAHKTHATKSAINTGINKILIIIISMIT